MRRRALQATIEQRRRTTRPVGEEEGPRQRCVRRRRHVEAISGIVTFRFLLLCLLTCPDLFGILATSGVEEVISPRNWISRSIQTLLPESAGARIVRYEA